MIFLIYSNPSDYESSPSVKGYTLSEEEAVEAVKKLKDSCLKAKSLSDKIHEASREFEKIETYSFRKLIDLPKWPSGIGKDKITEEMKKERQEIKNKNIEIIKEDSINHKEWRKKKMQYLLPIFEPFKNEEWFKEWFDFSDEYINCSVGSLVDNHEYYYESCEKI